MPMLLNTTQPLGWRCTPGISPGPRPEEPIIVPNHGPLIIDDPDTPMPDPDPDAGIDQGPIGDKPRKHPKLPPLDPPRPDAPPPRFLH